MIKINTLACVAVTLLFAQCLFAQKISADEIISKHLDSIGTPEKRSAIKNQIVVAGVQVIVNGTTAEISGKSVFVSEGSKNVWGMELSSNDYPRERFGFNGKDSRISYSRPGTRSTLGGFLYSNPVLLKDGLLGGTLFSSWTFLSNNSKKPKLSYEGVKKINGRDAYAIEYTPRGGSDLDITLYFDAENFRHIRTEYNRTIAARQGASIDSSAGQSPERYRLTEDFSDFRTVEGLTIPRVYSLSYSSSGVASLQLAQAANREIEWKFKVTNFTTNQDIDPRTFDIETK